MIADRSIDFIILLKTYYRLKISQISVCLPFCLNGMIIFSFTLIYVKKIKGKYKHKKTIRKRILQKMTKHRCIIQKKLINILMQLCI